MLVVFRGLYIVYAKTYYATHPQMMAGASNDDLRDRYLVANLFDDGKIILNYSHGERFIIGGAVPLDTPLELPAHTAPESDRGRPLLERRELGIVNVGRFQGRVVVDGEPFELERYEALYVPMGTKMVSFEGLGSRFYLLSVAAHRPFPTRKITLMDHEPMLRGTAEASNDRTIHQLVLPHLCSSASLCLGLTKLKPGSVWNTMPPHVHERRSEIYLYFDLEAEDRVFHYMGRPDDMRHIVMQNEEAVISPPWSVHMGAGTRNYSFVWAMAGENQDYEDMDVCDVCQLR